MKFYLPKEITVTSTNVSSTQDENGVQYNQYDHKQGYPKGYLVQSGNYLYEAFTDIYPLAKYRWEDIIFDKRYGIDLHNKTNISDPTAVPIVEDETVVYVQSNQKYYIAKTTGTVNFMTEDYISPANFTEITTTPVPYRYEYNEPAETKNTLFWRYVSATNYHKVFDRVIGTQTRKQDLIEYTFTAIATSGISFFNINAEELYIKVVDNITTDTVYEETINLIDTSHLDNYEKVCTVPWLYYKNKTTLYPARASQTITVRISTTSGTVGIGAIKAGLIDYIGKTLDGVSVNNKSYNEVEQRDNGEKIWNPDNKETNVVYEIRYNLLIDTPTFDSMLNKIKSITDKEVVLIGDDNDEIQFQTTVNYGAIINSDGSLTAHRNKSNLSIAIENFI
jgi:hypothetical protein